MEGMASFTSALDVKHYLESLYKGYGKYGEALWKDGDGFTLRSQIASASPDTLMKFGVAEHEVRDLIKKAADAEKESRASAFESQLDRLKRLYTEARVPDEQIVEAVMAGVQRYKSAYSTTAAPPAQSNEPGVLKHFGQRWRLVEREGQVKVIVTRWSRSFEEQLQRIDPDGATNSELQYQNRGGYIIIVIGPPGSGKTRLIDDLPKIVADTPAESIPNDRTQSFRRILKESMAGPEPLHFFLDISSLDISNSTWGSQMDWLAAVPGRWLGLLSLLMQLDRYRKVGGLQTILDFFPEKVVVWLEAHHVWLAMHKLRGLDASFIHLAMDEAAVLKGHAKNRTRHAFSHFPIQVGRLAPQVSVVLTLCSTRIMGGPSPASGPQTDSPSQGADRMDDAATRLTESDLIDKTTSSGQQNVAQVFLTRISQDGAATLLRQTCAEAGISVPERLPKSVFTMLEYASARPRLLEMAIAAMSGSDQHSLVHVDKLREFVRSCTYGLLIRAFQTLREFVRQTEYFKCGESRFGDGRGKLEIYKALVVSSLRGCKHPAKAPIHPTTNVTWSDAVESGHIDNVSEDGNHIEPRMPPVILETFLGQPEATPLRPLLNLFGHETASFTGEEKENTDLSAIMLQIKLLQLTGQKVGCLREILNLPVPFPDGHPMEWPLRLEGLNLEDQRLRAPWSDSKYEEKVEEISAYYGSSNSRSKTAGTQKKLLDVGAGRAVGGRGLKRKQSASVVASADVPEVIQARAESEPQGGVAGSPGSAEKGVFGVTDAAGGTLRMSAGLGVVPEPEGKEGEAALERRPSAEEMNGGAAQAKVSPAEECAQGLAGTLECAQGLTGTLEENAVASRREGLQAAAPGGVTVDVTGTLGSGGNNNRPEAKSARSLLNAFDEVRPALTGLERKGSKPEQEGGEGPTSDEHKQADALGSVHLDKLGLADGGELASQTDVLEDAGTAMPAVPLAQQPEDGGETSESGPASSKRKRGVGGEKGGRKKPRPEPVSEPSERATSPKESGPKESDKGSGRGVSQNRFDSGVSEGVGAALEDERCAESPSPKPWSGVKKRQLCDGQIIAEGASGKPPPVRGPTLFFQGAPKAERPDAFAFLPRAPVKAPRSSSRQRDPASPPPKTMCVSRGKKRAALRTLLNLQIQSKSSLEPYRKVMTVQAFKDLVSPEVAKMYSPNDPCSLFLICMDKYEPKGVDLGYSNVVVLDRTHWRNLYLELGRFKREVFDLLEALRGVNSAPPPSEDRVAGYYCPEELCRKPAYILRGNFINHLIKVHGWTDAEAASMADSAEV